MHIRHAVGAFLLGCAAVIVLRDLSVPVSDTLVAAAAAAGAAYMLAGGAKRLGGATLRKTDGSLSVEATAPTLAEAEEYFRALERDPHEPEDALDHAERPQPPADAEIAERPAPRPRKPAARNKPIARKASAKKKVRR